MKPLSILTLVLLVFQGCSNNEKSSSLDNVEERIVLVDRSLCPQIRIEGDSLWSVEERMKHYGVPGVSMAVIKDFKIDYVKSYGYVDKEKSAAVTGETLFQAGSISKPVAAYAALKMVEQKKLDLDADINHYLRSWKLPENEFNAKDKVTLRHLLSHSAGLTVHGFPGYSPTEPVPTLVQVLDGIAPANTDPIRVDKKPGESFRYSGGGYTVMQQMMIDVQSKTFPDIMQQLVLSPLEMKHSTYDQPLNEMQIRLAATGYLPDGKMTDGKRHTYPEMAAAGLWTTAEDLAKFFVDVQRTYKGESSTVLSQSTVKNMLTPTVADFIGLGMFIDKKKDEVYVGHNGWDEGFSSYAMVHRDKGDGVVILINSNHPAFLNEMVRAVALTYNWPNFVPTFKKLELDSAKARSFTGRYKFGNDEVIEIDLQNKRLFSKSLKGTSELFRVSEDEYMSNNRPTPVKFEKEDNVNTIHVLDPEKGKTQMRFIQMPPNEKLPIEFLLEGQFDKALKGYKDLKLANAEDPAIIEENVNGRGYDLLYGGRPELGELVFKVNIALYPNSSNVYDSYAEACLVNGKKEEALTNYKKSLEMNPKNENAKKKIEEIESGK
jgi:CubicO group peptidase (beta-lactamase class C family)